MDFSRLEDSKCLASCSFKIPKQKLIMWGTQKRFPFVIRGKNGSIKLNRYFVNQTEALSPSNIKIYSAHDNVSRPRNKFIIARSVLSKLVKKSYLGDMNDVSKITSLIWKLNHNGNFQKYFSYLSQNEDHWHESYFPLYHYNPKKEAFSSREQQASIILMTEPTIIEMEKSNLIPTKYMDDISDYIRLCDGKSDIKRSRKPKSYQDCTGKYSLESGVKKSRKKSRAQKMAPRYCGSCQFSNFLSERIEDVCVLDFNGSTGYETRI